MTDSADQVVDVFKPGAGGVQTYEAELTGPPKSSFGEPNGIAVDEATGDVYVIDLGSQVVDVFKPEAGGKYEYLSQLTGPPWTKFERIGRRRDRPSQRRSIRELTGAPKLGLPV